jgi:hypothetical protein
LSRAMVPAMMAVLAVVILGVGVELAIRVTG